MQRGTFGDQNAQKGVKMEPKGSNFDQNGAERRPKGAKMEPEGPNLAQNGAERGPENIEKSMPEKRSAPGRCGRDLLVHAGRLFGRKGRPGDRFWRSFWKHFISKMQSKIDTEIESQKT